MTDPVLERLLAAVIADPGDDGPRLAFADRLEETGADDDRAEFIRVQCELEPLRSHGHGTGNPHGDDCPTCSRVVRLERRGRELLLPDLHGRWLPEALAGRVGGLGVPSHRFLRGFVGEVELPCAAWLRHGPALVRAAPLERVRLTDKEPTGYPAVSELKNYWRWFDGSRENSPDSCDPDELPGALWRYYAAEMTRRRQTWDHPDRADGESCLSAACLAWARSVATPPPAPLN